MVDLHLKPGNCIRLIEGLVRFLYSVTYGLGPRLVSRSPLHVLLQKLFSIEDRRQGGAICS